MEWGVILEPEREGGREGECLCLESVFYCHSLCLKFVFYCHSIVRLATPPCGH